MGSVEPDITTLPLPDGQMGVTAAWKLPDGRYLRHAVRVPAGHIDEAKQKLKEWHDAQRQAETEAAS